MSEPKLTGPRRDGLLAVLAGERAGTEVRVSNVTRQQGRPSVYWQVARWMVAEGLAVDELGPTDGLRLTPAGRVLAGKLAARERAAR